MPVKTVTLSVVAVTDEANRQIRATGAYFDDLRAKNPVTLEVRLNRLQAIAESRILAKEMATTVTDTLKLETDRGGGGIRGFLGGIGGAGGNLAGGLFGVGGAGGAAGGAGVLAGAGQFLSTPGGAAAGIAALPFLAQAAASVITFGLGGALAGIGVYAEKGVKSVQAQFAGLQADVTKTFTNISPPFGEALTTILSAARTFVPQFIRAFGPALDAIAGPLKSFGVEIAANLAKPEVADSLKALGDAFGGILKALTPALPGIFTAVADGFTNVFRAVARNPKPFADLIIGLGHLAGIALDTIAWLTQVANFVEQRFVPMWVRFGHDLVTPFAVATSAALGAPKEFERAGGLMITAGDRIAKFFTSWGHDIAAQWDGVGRHIVGTWNVAWSETISRLSGAVGTVNATLAGWAGDVGRFVGQAVAWFRGLPGRILAGLAGLPGLLFAAGQRAMSGLLGGLGSMVGGILSTVAGWAHSIASALTLPFGIHLSEPSEATVMIKAGRNIMTGLDKGMRSAPLPGMFGSPAGTGGATVLVPGTGGYRPANVIITVEGGTPRSEADAFMVSWLNRLIATGHLNVKTVP